MDKKKLDVFALRVGELTGAGLKVAVDPEEADAMGAFVETALSAEEAEESRFDDTAEEDRA